MGDFGQTKNVILDMFSWLPSNVQLSWACLWENFGAAG